MRRRRPRWRMMRLAPATPSHSGRPDRPRSGQNGVSLARSQPKSAETGRKCEPQTGPPAPRKPCKQAKLRAGERLDRTQEVAGSSPASSTRRTPAMVRVRRCAGGYKRRLPLDRWPGSWPDLRAGQRPRRMRNRIIKRFRRYDRLSPGDSIELHLGALRFEFPVVELPRRGHLPAR
jgi:hypothetical protein